MENNDIRKQMLLKWQQERSKSEKKLSKSKKVVLSKTAASSKTPLRHGARTPMTNPRALLNQRKQLGNERENKQKKIESANYKIRKGLVPFYRLAEALTLQGLKLELNRTSDVFTLKLDLNSVAGANNVLNWAKISAELAASANASLSKTTVNHERGKENDDLREDDGLNSAIDSLGSLSLTPSPMSTATRTVSRLSDQTPPRTPHIPSKFTDDNIVRGRHSCELTGLWYDDKLEYYSSIEHATKATAAYQIICRDSSRALALTRFFTKCYYATAGKKVKNFGRLIGAPTASSIELPTPPVPSSKSKCKRCGLTVSQCASQYIGSYIEVSRNSLSSEGGTSVDESNGISVTNITNVQKTPQLFDSTDISIETRKIESYDCATRIMCVDEPFNMPLSSLSDASYKIRRPIENDIEIDLLRDPLLVHARSTEGTSRKYFFTIYGLKLGWTCLHIAAYAGNPFICKMLLKHGALPYERDLTGRMPLHVAASQPKKTLRNPENEIDHLATMKILAQSMEFHTGESPMGTTAPSDLAGYTPSAWLLEGTRLEGAEDILHKPGDSFVSPFITRNRKPSTGRKNCLRSNTLKKLTRQRSSDKLMEKPIMNSILHKQIRFKRSNEKGIETPHSLRKGGHINGEMFPFGTPSHGGQITESKITYGMAELNGFRPTMEDEKLLIFAIFDGHGGDGASKYCANHIATHIQRAHIAFDSEKSKAIEWSEIFKQASQTLDSSLREHQLYKGKGLGGDVALDSSGCVGVILVVTPTHLIFANVGDCRSLIVRTSVVNEKSQSTKSEFDEQCIKVEQISIDHKPTMPDEIARIEAAGFEVVNGRVKNTASKNGGSLGMSRAFGDFEFKSKRVDDRNMDVSQNKNTGSMKEPNDAVTCQPYVRVVQRNPLDKFVVLGCDGVFDVLSNEECVDHLLSKKEFCSSAKTINEACHSLVHHALAKGSRDNITAMVIAVPFIELADCKTKRTVEKGNSKKCARKQLFNTRT